MITIDSLRNAYANAFQSGGNVRRMQGGSGSGFFGSIGDKLDNGVNKISSAGRAVGSAAKSAGEWVGDEARKGVGAVGDAAKTVGKGIVSGVEAVGDAAKTVGKGIVSGVEAVAPYTVPGMAYNFGKGFISGVRGNGSEGDVAEEAATQRGGTSSGASNVGGNRSGGPGGPYYSYPGTGDYKWYPGLDVRPGEEMPDVEIPNRLPDEIDNEEEEAAKRQGVIDRLNQAEREKMAGFTALDIDLSDIDDKALADLKSSTDRGSGISRGPVVDPKDRAYNEMYNTYSNKQLRQYKRGKINNALSVGQNDWQRKQTVRAIKNGMEERPTDYKAVSRSKRSARNGGIMMRTFLSAMRRGGRLVGRYQGGGSRIF